MSSKTYAITLNGVEYIMTARELTNISEVITGINPTTAEYTGSAITVSPISEKVLVEGADYSITYSDNVSVGNCLVTINGLGDYSGSVSFTLEITPVPTVDISEVVTEINPTTAEYTGEPITVVPISEVELTEGVDYSIEYTDNVSVGECIVTISGIGNYSGTAEFILEITEATNSNSEPENTNSNGSDDSESSENTESDDSTDTNSETLDDTDNSEGSETP